MRVRALTQAGIFQNRKWVRLTSGCSLWRGVLRFQSLVRRLAQRNKKEKKKKERKVWRYKAKCKSMEQEPNPKALCQSAGELKHGSWRQSQGDVETAVGSVDRQHFTGDMMKGLKCLKDWNCLQFSLLSFSSFSKWNGMKFQKKKNQCSIKKLWDKHAIVENIIFLESERLRFESQVCPRWTEES